jgi:hypothetical protein
LRLQAGICCGFRIVYFAAIATWLYFQKDPAFSFSKVIISTAKNNKAGIPEVCKELANRHSQC